MKFQEAFNQAYDREAKIVQGFAVTAGTAKTLAFLWNMLKAAAGPEGQIVLDDFVRIGDNNEIISYPAAPKAGQPDKPIEPGQKKAAVIDNGSKKGKTVKAGTKPID